MYLIFLILKKFNIQLKKNNFIFSISIISKIGIFLGTFILVISFSALNGFEYELKNRVISIIPHGEITSINSHFHHWEKIKKSIESVSDVISVEPYVSVTALIHTSKNMKVIQLRGLNFNSNNVKKKLSQFVSYNILSNIKDNNSQIIIGKKIAESLFIKKQDWINVIFPNNKSSFLNFKNKNVSLKIFDFFQINAIFDNVLGLVPITDLQKCLNIKSNITGLEVTLKNPWNATKILKKIENIIPSNFVIKNWINCYSYIYHDIQLIKLIIYFTTLLIIISSCFNVASTTLLHVSKKTNSIAILKTLGINNNIIKIIFLLHGLFSILKIGLFSILFSIFVLLNIKHCIYYLENLLGKKILVKNIYFIDFIPIHISFLNISTIFCILTLLGLLTSLYPAYWASKVSPVQILKKY